MSFFSAQHLRDEFKNHLDKWENASNNKRSDADLLAEIQNWGCHIEKSIQDKIHLLENDFVEYQLQGEYLRSVNEGFDDLNRIMKTNNTLLDIIQGENLTTVLKKIKQHYKEYLVPLLNILAKLENDYVAIASKAIADKAKIIEKIDTHLKELKEEKLRIKKRLFDFNRKVKYTKILREIQRLELRKKITRLTMHHNKLNLYYFNHDRPPELQEIKQKADRLRDELLKVEKEVNHETN